MYKKSGSLMASTLLLLSHMEFISNSNILIVLPLPARSHFKSFQPLLEELIRRGHNLTLIGFEKLHQSFSNTYTHIDVSHLTMAKLGVNFADLRKQDKSALEIFMFYNLCISEHMKMLLEEPAVQHLLHSEDTKFDLVMIELFYIDVYVAFGYHFTAPVIGLNAQAMISVYKWISGNPLSISYTPNSLLPLTGKMSLLNRLWNVGFTLSTVLYYEFISLPRSQKIMEKYFPFQDEKTIPKIKDMMKNISLIFSDYHFTFGYPTPMLPNCIEIAGLHITDPDPLSEELKKFMDEATFGVIYVSLGSILQPDDLDVMGKTFINVLKRLPQKVIFKWNPKMISSKPDNFFVQEWAPQISILKHQNCRLFITHGGIHSLFEAINNSVPIIGIPFVSDQHHNIALAEHLGTGIKLDFNFNEEQLLNAIQEVLTNPKYSENMKLQSGRFNDRMVSPLDTAIYWVEYVLRHKELYFMKSALTDLSLYEYLLLDVFLAILALILLLYIILKCLIFNCRAIFISKINSLTNIKPKVQ